MWSTMGKGCVPLLLDMATTVMTLLTLQFSIMPTDTDRQSPDFVFYVSKTKVSDLVSPHGRELCLFAIYVYLCVDVYMCMCLVHLQYVNCVCVCVCVCVCEMCVCVCVYVCVLRSCNCVWAITTSS